MDIDKYRDDAENFLSEVDKEYYMHFSGHKEDLNIASIYSKYDSLFSHENFEKIKSLEEELQSIQKKKLAYLKKFCAEGNLENHARDFIDLIGQEEASCIIEIDGKEVPFRYSEVLLSNEADKVKRDEIDDKRKLAVKKLLNPSLMDYWKSVYSQVENFGYKNYKDLISYLKQQDFEQLGRQMDVLLSETNEIYIEHFGRLVKNELQIDLGNSRRSDFAYLRRAVKYDVFFKKEELVSIFKDTLLEMGIDINTQQNIVLDVEERKNKSPRAFCATVKIPGEIYLVVMPKGGQDDFEAMFHEGGHAEHFAFTNPGLDFEYKFLGDNSVTEGYAFTLEHLIQNSNWLDYFLGMPNDAIKDFLYFSNISKLWFCRRYAGKLKYELLLHGDGVIQDRSNDYKNIMESASMMQYSGSDYLKDVDEAFYCTNYIRAWIFEAQLKDYIHRKFGYDWFKKKKAGYFLKEIFSYGQKYDPVEILKQLDFEGLDINYLIDSLKSEIKNNL